MEISIHQNSRLLLLLCGLFICGLPYAGFGQATLTLDSCYLLARENYPLIQKHALIDRSRDYTIDNATTTHLPQFSFGAQASYQSAVTEIPLKIPGVHIESLDKDQYKAYADVQQTIYDGGQLKENKNAITAASRVEEKSLEVRLYALKDEINQLYFGLLLIAEARRLNQLHQQDIQTALEKTQAMIKGGTALKSNAALLEAEKLDIQQEATNLASNRKAYLQQLGMFLHRQLDTTTKLAIPEMPVLTMDNSRPELSLFDAQKELLHVKTALTYQLNKPKIGLFMQGGYGRPGLNMLRNRFDPYYIGGVRLSLPLDGLYTAKKQRKLIDIDQKSIDIQKEAFLFDTRLAATQQSTEIERYRSLLVTDDQLIALRTEVKQTAWAQLQNGVLTIHEYIRELNEENQARQNKSLHQIELLNIAYHKKTTLGE